MTTASRARLLLASAVFACACALLLAPGGQAQVLPPLPLPSATPSPTATPTPTALPGPGVPAPSPLACTPSASVPNSPPSCPLRSPASAPAPPCSLPPLKSGEFRQIDDLTPSPEWWYGASLAVDPTNPCHLFTTGRTKSATTSAREGFPMTVYRGDVTSSGARWNAVFTMPEEPDQSAPLTVGSNNFENTGPPAAKQSAPVVGPNGAVWLAGTTPARGTGYAAVHLARVFSSADTGSHWGEKDNGIVAQDPTADWSQAFAAPSDPNVAYVLTMPTQLTNPALLYATTDGGATWSTRPLPGGRHVAMSDDGNSSAPLIIDPADARTLYYLPNTQLPLWVSHDAGSSWTPQGPSTQAPQLPQLPPGAVNNSLAVHQPGRPPLLYVHVVYGGPPGGNPPTAAGGVPVPPVTNGWYSSGDLGVTWQQLPVPADSPCVSRPCTNTGVPSSFVVADPTDPNVMVWSDGGTNQSSHGLELRITTDAFGGQPQIRVVVPTLGDSVGMTVDSLQTDARGDFFLALERCHTCDATQDPSHYQTAATVLAFRPPSGQSGGTITFTLGGTTLQSSSSSSTSTSAGALPVEPPVAPTQSCAVSAGEAGSIAFDGRYVDYTQDATPAGTIFRLDAKGCAPQSPLILNPGDFPTGTVPDLISLTFDARYGWPDGREGALLGSAPAGFDSRLPVTDVPIYAIDPVTAKSELLWHVTTRGQGCGYGGTAGSETPTGDQRYPLACPDASFFSYDVFRRILWSIGTAARPTPVDDNAHPGYLTPDSAFHDNCFSTFGSLSLNQSGTGFGIGLAAGVVGGDGYLYALWEDDQTVLKMTADTCQIVGGFRFGGAAGTATGENPNEDEQIACDPLSFSTPMIWVRNSLVKTAEAFPVPDAVCPFVTRISYSPPTGQILPGRAMTLCYTLEAALDSVWQPVVGQPIRVRVGGLDLGHPLTDQSGRACLTKPAPSTFGSSQVVGDFAGTAAYLPVSVTAGIDIPGGHGGPIAFAVGEVAPGAPPPSSGSQSPSETGSQAPANASAESVLQAQMQAQLQTQAQTQSVAQAQPGVVMQRQRRVQIAMQEQGVQTNVAYEATALRRGRAVPAGAVAAALMMLGGALAWRRPRVEVSRATRARRGRRA